MMGLDILADALTILLYRAGKVMMRFDIIASSVQDSERRHVEKNRSSDLRAIVRRSYAAQMAEAVEGLERYKVFLSSVL